VADGRPPYLIEGTPMPKRTWSTTLGARCRLCLEALEDRTTPVITSHSVSLLNGPAPPGDAAYAPGEILVGFQGSIVDTYHGRGAAVALEAAGKIVGGLGLGNPSVLYDLPAVAGHGPRLVTLWNLPANANVRATAAHVAARAGVAYAEPNWMLSIQATASDPSLATPTPAGWPFGLQEHLSQIGATTAWDTSTGGPTTVGGLPFAGRSQVVVSVIDTGVDLDHPDLNGNLFRNSNGAVVGKNFQSNKPTAPPQDDNGHGTHVAGIIAAEVNNLADKAIQATSDAWKGGTVGVAPFAKIMPVKVLNAGGSGFVSVIADGIKFAADNGANIISMSLGGPFSQAVDDQVAYAYSQGILVISAAGNGNAEGSSDPASSPYSLSVAAVDQNDVRAGFSNYGFTVDVAAPGVNVLSTFIDINGSQSGSFTGAYGRIGGTSMATPIVSGVAALIMSLHSDWTVDDVAAQILATANNIDIQNPSFAGRLGAGRVNALDAVGPLVTTPEVIAVGIQANATGRPEFGSVIGVQFSHAMTAGVLNLANYQLKYLGADGVPGGSDDENIPLVMDSIDYIPFPGQGVQLHIAGPVPDGVCQFTVDGSGVSPNLVGNYTRIFAPPQITTNAVSPVGSLVYRRTMGDQFDQNGSGAGQDTDRFILNVDGGQVVTLRLTTTATATVAVQLNGSAVSGLTDVDPGTGVLYQGIGSGAGGTIQVQVTATGLTAATPYSLQATLNAVYEVGTAQNVDDTFVTLVGANALGTGPAYTADRAALLGTLGGSYSPQSLLDGFESGTLSAYKSPINPPKPAANFSVTTTAKHDGTNGLQITDGNGWIMRTDTTAQVKRGDFISVWARSVGAPTGRFYFGFGGSSSGTLSLVMAPNSGSLVLQRNAGYGFEDLGAVGQSWLPDRWYRMEIEWQMSGHIIGRLYDEDGTTPLNRVEGDDTTISSGGIVFRSFGSTRYVDTAQTVGPPTPTPDQYEFTLAAGEQASVVVKSLNGVTANVQLLGSGTTRYVQVTGDVGAQYSVLLSRNITFEAEGNDTKETAQDLTGQQGAFGSVGRTGDTADWYKVIAGSKAVWETRTPGDAPGEFVNNLNPHIELFDSDGNATGIPSMLLGGGNEQIMLPGPGTYYIRVTAEGGTLGDYVLIDPPAAQPEAAVQAIAAAAFQSEGQTIGSKVDARLAWWWEVLAEKPMPPVERSRGRIALATDSIGPSTDEVLHLLRVSEKGRTQKDAVIGAAATEESAEWLEWSQAIMPPF